MAPKQQPGPGQVVARQTRDGHSLVIDVVGRLGFDLHRQFRQSYEKQPKRYKRYAVNLKQCDSIDSTGLGMLLMLKDFAGLGKEGLLLVHCREEVAQVLKYASFDELFTIQSSSQPRSSAHP